MMKRVGILTSGGDCPGLNATIRGAAKALYQRFGSEVEIVGIQNGYDGLIKGEWREMQQHEFSGILTVGGTILGTKRTPFKMMKVVEGDNVDKVAAMKKTYRDARLDCLLCLGGNGTHKTANLLCEEGLNIIGLPKTIDNDIYGTDVTFGFHTAVDIATEVIDRIHTTASSHRRCMVIEIMGNKAGWLTLYSGIAGGADIILIPELPYNIENVVDAIKRRSEQGKTFSIIAVAEGAYDVAEAAMKKKERAARRAERGERTATSRIARQVEQMTGFETRVCVPGHMQRGGSPRAGHRVWHLCRQADRGRPLRRGGGHAQQHCHLQPAEGHCREDKTCAGNLRYAYRGAPHGHLAGLSAFAHPGLCRAGERTFPPAGQGAGVFPCCRRTARVVYFYSRKLRRGSFPQPGAPGCGVRAAGKGAGLCCSVRFCSCGFFCRWWQASIICCQRPGAGQKTGCCWWPAFSFTAGASRCIFC